MAMDSAEPHAFTFNEAVSLLVNCEDQAEIDRLWAALSAVPEAEACGWLKDRFGVSWQIAPRGARRDDDLRRPGGDRAGDRRVHGHEEARPRRRSSAPSPEPRRCRHERSAGHGSQRGRPTSPRCAPCSTPSPGASTTATPRAVNRHFAPDAVLADLAPPLLHRGPDTAGAAGMARRLGRAGRDHLPRPRGDGRRRARPLPRPRPHPDDPRRRGGGLVGADDHRARPHRDGWRVIHDHVSVPFYMDGSDRAALDLEPDSLTKGEPTMPDDLKIDARTMRGRDPLHRHGRQGRRGRRLLRPRLRRPRPRPDARRGGPEAGSCTARSRSTAAR